MPNQQLLDYIDFKSKQGTSNEDIKKLLLDASWKEEDIDAGFVYLNNQNKSSTEFVRKSPNAGSGIIFFIILFLLLAGGALAGYKYYYLPSKNVANNNVLNQSNSTTSATTVATSSTNEIVATTTSTCNNYDCLITAASQCKPIIAIIDFKVPHPIFPYMTISGKSKTSIKQVGSLTKCEFTSSYVGEEVASISQIEKDKLLAQGTTQSDIDFQLQDINNAFKNVGPIENICQSSASAIVQYFKDLKDGKTEDAEYNAKSTLDTSTTNTIYSTSLGQKITCVMTTVNQ
jgi:hypothetical protein